MLLLLSLSPAACHAPSTANAAAPAKATAPSDAALPIDRGEYTHARRLALTQRLDMPSTGTFARLDAAQRRHLQQLQRASAIHITILHTPERTLLILPAELPLGHAEVLLARDQRRLVVFAKDGWAYHLPPERLPDVLDWCLPSARTDLKAQRLADTAKPVGPARATRGPLSFRHAAFAMTFQYESSGHIHTAWPMRAQLEVETGNGALSGGDILLGSPTLLYSLAMPLFQTRAGRLVLESLATTAGIPTRWRRTLTNEAYPADASLSTTTVVVDEGWVRVPRARFQMVRAGHRIARRLPTPHIAGHQGLDSGQLSRLRSGKAGGNLEVHNKEQLSALLYLDGALVGWIGPKSTMVFRGPKQGFYQVYATAPTGVRTWGPRPTYLPGTVELRR